MIMDTLRCPKCEKTMERGHVPDASYGQVLQSSWAPGAPETRRFLGGIRYHPHELVPMTAYRYQGCGFVEFYAQSE